LAGNVQLMFDAITTMAQLAQAGKVRAIATSGKARSSTTPDVPTLDLAGLPGYDAVIWLGMMAPVATPKPIVDQLNTEIQKIAGLPDVKEVWAKQGAVPMYMTSAEFGKFMEQDIQKWAKVVAFSGAKVD
jgi:tripartite-type tricarboxylate transporter receptor subunit TctC